MMRSRPSPPSAAIVNCGVDHSRWHDLALERSDDAILALGRGNPLKNFPLTRAAYALMVALLPATDSRE